MGTSFSDWLDCPVSTPASRRHVLIGISVALFATACTERHPAAPRDRIDPAPDPAFLKLSIALTGKNDLDPLTAARLSAAFRQLAPDVHRQFASLARLHATAPEALLTAAESNSVKAAALAIVAAWYTGSLGKSPHSATIAYRDALMQRTVADAMYPPTYAAGGPGWWTAPPPAVNDGQKISSTRRPLASNDTEPRQ